MKKIITVLILTIMCMNQLHSQYYKWAHEIPFSQNGRNISKMAVDTAGNVYTLGINQPCIGCTELFVRKEDKDGNFKYEYTASPIGGTVAGTCITVDKAGNAFISATKTSGTIIIGSTTINNSGFIFKLNSAGNVMWALQNESGYLAADTAGALYVTNGIYTKKYTSAGIMKWQYVSLRNVTGIGVDIFGRCFVSSTDSIIKINKVGKNILYAKNYGSNNMVLNDKGNAFLLTDSSLTKLNRSGAVTFTINTGGSSLAIDKTSAIYIAANNSTLKKISSTGLTTAWTMTSVNAPFTNVGVDNSKNVYVCGNYNSAYLTILSPFKLADKNGGSFANAQSFTASISNASPFPFQAGIFTGDFYPVNGNTICKNQVLQIPYTYSLNRLGSFGPVNEFRAQISDDNFLTYTDIGPADSAVISIPANRSITLYRIRVVSTDPPVNGYPNYSISVDASLTLTDNNASIIASGPTSFCPGNSVQLSASLQPYTTAVDWYRGNTFLGNDTSITATDSGDYRATFHNGTCDAISNIITVTPYPKLPVTIAPSGPTTFCSGGSVLLTANPSTGFTYQWRKTGINIPGATSATYLATTAGKYSVQTINIYGCLKFSYAITVSVPCRLGEESASASELAYPNPFSKTITISDNEILTGIKVRNLLGKIVFEKKLKDVENVAELDLSTLTDGVYFMEIQNSTGSRLIRVVKQK